MPERDGIADVVQRFEIMSNRLGAALQGQTQQAASVHHLIATLHKLLSDLLSAVLANRATLAEIEARLNGMSSPLAMKIKLTDGTGDEAPVIVVRPLGNLGNRMIQHMVAMSLASRVPGSRISRVELPEWGLVRRDDNDEGPASSLEIASMRADLHHFAARMRRGELTTVSISGYAQHVDNLLQPETYKKTFIAQEDVSGFGPEYLVISLRMGDIASGEHPPYVLLPISFYEEIVHETGLKPVFFGQLTPSRYLDALIRAFPHARFVAGRRPIHDFETIRRSRNILLSVSTFAWLAAWLSEADQVMMPLAGLFNPLFGRLYGGGHNLVPRNDPRFRFHLFPLSVASKPDELAAYHDAIRGRWREVTSLEIEAAIMRHDTIERSFDAHARLFDEAYYLNRHPEIRIAVEEGRVESGLRHYELHGFDEKRSCFGLDLDYSVRYPDAGLAVSAGDFYDLHHFHAERGNALGYLPTRNDRVARPGRRRKPVRAGRKPDHGYG